MGATYTTLHRDLRSYGRREVRVGRLGDGWRVVFYLNGQFHQQAREISEGQARGEAARVVTHHGYVSQSDLPPVPDDGLWHGTSAEGATDE